ncbi:MAG: helix-turn-helix domain-containing protein [Mycobacteriales bacterium]
MTAPARVESSQALDRGLRLLALLAGADRGLSVSELADGLGTSRAAVYRLVAALEAHAMVRRPADGRVRLGLGLLDLARRVLPELRDAARGPLRALAERVGATAHLTVLDGDDALAVAVVEPSWTDFHVGYRVGTRHRVDRGAAGRAILLGRAPATGGDIAVTAGELQPGAHGVAAPVRDLPGLEASVGVVALADLDAAAVGPAVVEAAAAVGRRLR